MHKTNQPEYFIPRKLALFPDEHENVLSEDYHKARLLVQHVHAYTEPAPLHALIAIASQNTATAGCRMNTEPERIALARREYMCICTLIQRICVYTILVCV
jgi:hypothetical protein